MRRSPATEEAAPGLPRAGLPRARARVKAGHELGDVIVAAVELARLARRQEAGGLADLARVEIDKARFELFFERLEASEVRARLGELFLVDLTHIDHRARSRAELLPIAHDGLNVTEAEAHVLELPDPPDT